jgi:Kef-type K+ transport system membrane component KefB
MQIVSRRGRETRLLGCLLLGLIAIGFLPAAVRAAGPTTASFVQVSPDFNELSAFGEHARTYRIMLVCFQLAIILASAKLAGWVCELIKIPGVIGELLAGVLVGPFLLGSIIPIPIHGHWVPLFPKPLSADQWPVNEVIWALAQFASIILLFITGLHTDLKQFLRYAGPAALIATAGLLVPMALGVGTVYIPFFTKLAQAGSDEPVLVAALFVGAILAATSIGITARVLSDISKLDTPEAVTIIGAAVLDDVLGIIALAIVGGIASAGTISLGAVGVIASKAMGFWIGLTLAVLFLAKPIERLLLKINYAGAMVGIGLALAFMSSGAAEGFGLAFIIGAYSVGLGLSRTAIAHRLMDEMQPIYDFMVPIFFASLGMLVNFQLMLSDWRVIVFGVVLTVAAIVGKLVGCGSAALLTGFNMKGAYRIGLGMTPRGEVALIVAGIGLSRKLIQNNVFGVSIMMTLITTILAPMLLVPAFRGGSGRRRAAEDKPTLPGHSVLPGLEIAVPHDLGEMMLNRLLDLARQAGWVATLEDAAGEIYLLRSDGDAAQVHLDRGGKLLINASDRRQKEFETLITQVRQSVLADAEKAQATVCRSNPG